MLASFLRLFRLVCIFLRGHQALVLENLALRQQLSMYKRKRRRPRLTPWDRWFLIVLAGHWKGWRKCLLVVHPDSVVRWHRQRFRRYWAQLSDEPLRAALKDHERRATMVLDLEERVAAAVKKLKERGLVSPYLRSFVGSAHQPAALD